MLLSGWNIHNSLRPIHIVSLIFFFVFISLAIATVFYYAIYIKMVSKANKAITECELIVKMTFSNNLKKVRHYVLEQDKLQTQNLPKDLGFESRDQFGCILKYWDKIYFSQIVEGYKQNIGDLRFVFGNNRKFLPSIKKYKNIKKNYELLNQIHDDLINFDVRIRETLRIEEVLKSHRINSIEVLNELVDEFSIIMFSLNHEIENKIINSRKIKRNFDEIIAFLYREFKVMRLMLIEGRFTEANKKQLEITKKIGTLANFLDISVVVIKVLNTVFAERIEKIKQKLEASDINQERKAIWNRIINSSELEIKSLQQKIYQSIEKFDLQSDLSEVSIIDKMIANLKFTLDFEIKTIDFISKNKEFNETIFISLDERFETILSMISQTNRKDISSATLQQIEEKTNSLHEIYMEIKNNFEALDKISESQNINVEMIKNNIESDYKKLRNLDKEIQKILINLKPNFNLNKQFQNDYNYLNSLIANISNLLFKNKEINGYNIFENNFIELKTETRNFSNLDLVKHDFISNDNESLDEAKGMLSELLDSAKQLNDKIRSEIALFELAKISIAYFASKYTLKESFVWDLEAIEALMDKKEYELAIKTTIIIIERYGK